MALSKPVDPRELLEAITHAVGIERTGPAARDWTDPRDGRHWTVWLGRGGKPVLVFASEGELLSVVVDFDVRLRDRSDADLQRLLDEGRG